MLLERRESHSSACPQTQKLSTLLRRSRLQRSLTASPTFAASLTVSQPPLNAASILDEEDAISKLHRHPPPSSTSSFSRRNMSERISRSPRGQHSPQGKLSERDHITNQPAKCGLESSPTKRVARRSKTSVTVSGNSWP
ncbi:hypothetical protein F2Q68_00037513 [Brassica cretica]|uniref:DUF4005 domain-containing protein n=2 Tax=Brassica cretica TaxID=69181 RepID=A0ABQ7E9N1_BRACR|nr:hypothetical protein F2Q68_00037513 [Brassica cretica]KAF3593712.1 hypothetical protein DY000_02027452 [Brassica cretica]